MYKLKFLRSLAHRAGGMTYALRCFKLHILKAVQTFTLGSHSLLPKFSQALFGKMLDNDTNQGQH